ncbi:MAG: stress-induced protein [Gemmatimonadetes bacterium]|nr:stress-induced protein [Gemmatimonadota bacterium]
MANRPGFDDRTNAGGSDRERTREVSDETNRDAQSGSSANGSGTNGSRRSNRGFASMDRSKQKEIASKGGRAAHAKGTAHEFDSGEARDAGRKGGQAVSRNREHMAAIGRKGGEARGQRRAALSQGGAQGNGTPRGSSGGAQNTRGSSTDNTRGVSDREIGISVQGGNGSRENTRSGSALGGERRPGSSAAGGVEGSQNARAEQGSTDSH